MDVSCEGGRASLGEGLFVGVIRSKTSCGESIIGSSSSTERSTTALVAVETGVGRLNVDDAGVGRLNADDDATDEDDVL